MVRTNAWEAGGGLQLKKTRLGGRETGAQQSLGWWSVGQWTERGLGSQDLGVSLSVCPLLGWALVTMPEADISLLNKQCHGELR